MTRPLKPWQRREPVQVLTRHQKFMSQVLELMRSNGASQEAIRCMENEISKDPRQGQLTGNTYCMNYTEQGRLCHASIPLGQRFCTGCKTILGIVDVPPPVQCTDHENCQLPQGHLRNARSGPQREGNVSFGDDTLDPSNSYASPEGRMVKPNFTGLLSYTEISALLNQGVVRGSKPEHVNGSSLDIMLGDEILAEQPMDFSVHLKHREPLNMDRFSMRDLGCFPLKPGDFILAQSLETFHLPLDISCEFKLKSSLARIGVNQLTACWCDPGWHDSVMTLELQNVTRHHTIVLRAGDPVGQVVFFRHASVPPCQLSSAMLSAVGTTTTPR